MSLVINSDNSKCLNSRLWWITEDGKIVSDQGHISLPVNLSLHVWKGISSLHERLLMWNDKELYEYNTSNEAIKLLIKPYQDHIERAAWSEQEKNIVEVFSQQTHGHPTDRSGFRIKLNTNTLEVQSMSFRQHRAPPWGSRGHVDICFDICSNSNGILFGEWIDLKKHYFWKKIGRGGKRQLSMELDQYYEFRLLRNDEIIYVCGFRNNRFILMDIKGESEIIRKKVSERINDACFHNGELYVAMKDSDPVAVIVNYSQKKL